MLTIRKLFCKKKTQSVKIVGFTLIEAVISIALFGIITVFMSNFVLSVGKFTLDNDKRNDILNDIEATSTILRNEIRNAREVTVDDENSDCIELSGGYNRIIRLAEVSNGTELIIEEGSTCGSGTAGTVLKKTNNARISKVQNLEFSFNSLVGVNDNSFYYLVVRVQFCDSDAYGITDDAEKIFGCSSNSNPYYSVFSVILGDNVVIEEDD